MGGTYSSPSHGTTLGPRSLLQWILNWLLSTAKGRVLLAFLLLRLAYRFWPKKSLKGKSLLVTGAGGGIGEQIALCLARKGANVVLWDINSSALEKVARQVQDINPECKVVTEVVDVTKRELVYAAADRATRELGFIWGVINNAGIVSGGKLLDIPDAKIIKTFEVNTLAHFWTIKAFLPAMWARNEGHLCSVASAAGLFGAAHMTDYSASKFAAVGLLESIRMELLKYGKNGVRTSLVCPSYVQTPLFTGYKPTWGTPALTPKYVAEKVVGAIQQRKQVVFLPRLCYLAAAIRGLLPTAIDDYSKHVLGLSSAMDHFQGRN